jgi:ferric-dicitrate binding protein FerR (iron transport regulator)
VVPDRSNRRNEPHAPMLTPGIGAREPRPGRCRSRCVGLSRALGLVGLAWVVLVLAGCRGGCRPDDVVAELSAARGGVERDTAAAVATWSAAEPGAEFRLGDGLRTGAGAEATLDLAGGSQVRVESETVIRFRDPASGSAAASVDVELGNAEVTAGDQPVRVTTPVGTAVVSRQGKLRVSSAGEGVRFAVTVGTVVLEERGGATRTLEQGQVLEIGSGEAILERPAAPKASSGRDAGAAPAPTGSITAVVTGPAASKKEPRDTAFAKLRAGETALEPGTLLRLNTGTTVAISRGSERATLVGGGEFVVGAGDGALVNVHSGKVALARADSAVRISAPGGVIVAAPRAAGDVAVGRDEARVTVQAQHVVIRTAAGGEEVIEAGQEGRLGRGGDTVVEGRSLDHPDIVFAAGESAVIHDPRPPTAVGYTLSCPEGGVVTLTGKGATFRVRGGTLTTASVPAGTYAYQVACIQDGAVSEAPVAEGNLTVLADAGTAPIPKSAPATRIDADGRNYTVLYQNHLPALSVTWPRPPQASRYTLTVSTGGQMRTLQVSGPSHTFGSGQVGEGTHRLQFVADGTARSKTTTVTIAFDNAAPKATLRTPIDESFAAGQQVTVSGVALPGWSVRAGGEPYSVDAQLRFSGQATAPADHRALDIVFSHPVRGTHHYLRRSSRAN